MLKNKTKFVVLLLAFLLVISTFTFATDTNVTTTQGEVDSTVVDEQTTRISKY